MASPARGTGALSSDMVTLSTAATAAQRQAAQAIVPIGAGCKQRHAVTSPSSQPSHRLLSPSRQRQLTPPKQASAERRNPNRTQKYLGSAPWGWVLGCGNTLSGCFLRGGKPSPKAILWLSRIKNVPPPRSCTKRSRPESLCAAQQPHPSSLLTPRAWRAAQNSSLNTFPWSLAAGIALILLPHLQHYLILNYLHQGVLLQT